MGVDEENLQVVEIRMKKNPDTHHLRYVHTYK